jgi:hypothetical protein
MKTSNKIFISLLLVQLLSLTYSIWNESQEMKAEKSLIAQLKKNKNIGPITYLRIEKAGSYEIVLSDENSIKNTKDWILQNGQLILPDWISSLSRAPIIIHVQSLPKIEINNKENLVDVMISDKRSNKTPVTCHIKQIGLSNVYLNNLIINQLESDLSKRQSEKYKHFDKNWATKLSLNQCIVDQSIIRLAANTKLNLRESHLKSAEIRQDYTSEIKLIGPGNRIEYKEK